MRISRAALALLVVCSGGVAGFIAAHFAGTHGGNQAFVAANPVSKRVVSGPASIRNSFAPPGQATAPSLPAGEREDSPTTIGHQIPADVPDLSLSDAGGIRHRLSEWKGRPLVINFWATWCEPCRREIPLLKTLRRENATHGVEVIGIAVDFREAVRRYARAMGIDYPVMVAEEDGLEAIAAFGMDTVFPFTVFADRRGRIVTLKIGELHAQDARLILDRVAAVDQGRVELPEARAQISEGIAALAVQRALVGDGSGASGSQAH